MSVFPSIITGSKEPIHKISPKVRICQKIKYFKTKALESKNTVRYETRITPRPFSEVNERNFTTKFIHLQLDTKLNTSHEGKQIFKPKLKINKKISNEDLFKDMDKSFGKALFVFPDLKKNTASIKIKKLNYGMHAKLYCFVN
jgi:hypothetical protein